MKLQRPTVLLGAAVLGSDAFLLYHTPIARTAPRRVWSSSLLLLSNNDQDREQLNDSLDQTTDAEAAPRQQPNPAAVIAPPPSKEMKCPDCNLCDGSGRITGGLGAVLPWFPVKAYRPCPNFIERGGIYERSGQGLDEIAFGRDASSSSSRKSSK